MEVRKMERRRGTALEDEILAAAWTELLTRGYSNFTMDAVALRAKTSRPVLYRRWLHRSDLAIAAMRNHIRNNPLNTPDTGTLRDDLIELLRATSERRVPLAIILLLQMNDLYAETGMSPAELREELLSGIQNSLNTVLLRGVARGEIDGSKLTPRIMSLPSDLVRHEVMMTLEAAPVSVIAEIIDEIFLPLVLVKGAGKIKKKIEAAPGSET